MAIPMAASPTVFIAPSLLVPISFAARPPARYILPSLRAHSHHHRHRHRVGTCRTSIRAYASPQTAKAEQGPLKPLSSNNDPSAPPAKDKPTAPPTAPPPRIKARRERPHVRRWDGEFVPRPLNRPLGLVHPPQAGQNDGKDRRTLRQRRDDFVSYDKHLERREDLVKNLYEKNYFRDIGNIGKIHKGKSILAPSTPFRANLARYFPNLQGRTLAKSGTGGSSVDMTPVLRGKVSVVSVLSSDWAREQCLSFVGEKENPDLHALLASAEARQYAQRVEVNVEENWLKYALIRAFFFRLRRQLSPEMWARYFLVRRGLTDEIRDALGIWNSKVGYIYLLDGACRVRWAGNGPARDDERKSLVTCLQRLLDEARGVPRSMKVDRQDARPTQSIRDLQAADASETGKAPIHVAAA